MKTRSCIFMICITVLSLQCVGIQPLGAVTLSVSNKGEGALQTTIALEVLKYIGTPYVSGGITKKGFDCSGLVYRVFHDVAAIDVPRMVEDLAKTGVPVTEPFQKADLILFDTDGKGKPSHVAISLGGSKFVHAASAGSKTGVIISELTEDYYKKRYLGTRRMIPPRYPSITVVLDNLVPAKQRFEGLITPGFPLYVNIQNKLSRSLFLSLKAYKDNRLVVSKRMKVQNTDQASSWFIPDDGKWTVSIEDAKNDEIVRIVLY